MEQFQSMSGNITPENINYRIGRIKHRAWRSLARKQHGLGGDELLPLRTSRAIESWREARKTVHHADLELTGSRRRRRWRRRHPDLWQRDGAVRSGADSRVPDSSESAGLEVLEERLGPARGRPVNCASPPIHVEEREMRREREWETKELQIEVERERGSF